MIAGVSLYYFFSLLNEELFSFQYALLLGLVFLLLHAAGQALNHSIPVEIEIDRLNNKNYRATVIGIVTSNEGKLFASILFLAGILIAFILHLNLGFFSVLITILAITYSASPFRIKEKYFINNFHQAIARGFLPVIFVASIYGHWRLATIFGFLLTSWIIGAQTTKDWNDIKGDKKFGVMSFPVMLGKKKTLWLMSIFMGSTFAFLNVFIILQLLPIGFAFLNLLIIPSIIIIYALHYDLISAHFENNLGWVCYGITLSLWFLLPIFLI
jgi:4-hydroxybenzoate polyprenyltransferase